MTRKEPLASVIATPAARAGRVKATGGAPRKRGRSEAESLDAAEHAAPLPAKRQGAVIEGINVDALLKRLHLANARRMWRSLIARAEAEEWSYEQFFAVLVAEEVAHRQQTRIGRLSHRAAFPYLKTIDDFNFTFQSTVRLQLLGSALSPDFVTQGNNLILYGRPGRGKTHLSIAIAYRAIQNGFDALFVTAAELIDELSAALREGRFADVLATYTHPALLVVDEVGYLTYGTDAANMLFHVVNERHKRGRSMVFTTNKPLPTWGRVLHDQDLAEAIVDRVLERGRLLTLDGPSMRTKHLGLDDPTTAATSTQPARVSGIDRQEFPEPTRGRGHLADQVTRASTSIVLNIAEGAGKFSKPDKRRYYLSALRSTTECAAILDVCVRLKLLAGDAHSTGKAMLERVAAMLIKLAKSLQEP